MNQKSVHITYECTGGRIEREDYAFFDDVQYELIKSKTTSTICMIDWNERIKVSYSENAFGKYKLVEKLDLNATLIYDEPVIIIDRKQTKEILGYTCFLVTLKTSLRGKEGRFHVYTTESFSNIPLKHKLHRQFPNKVPGIPLEVTSNEFYSMKAIHIADHSSNPDIFNVNDDEYTLTDSPGTDFSLIQILTGSSSNSFKEKLIQIMKSKG